MISPANVNPTWTEEGRLQVDAYDTDVGRPAPGAQIQIAPSDNPASVIEELYTNDVGQTALLDLPTPPAELSLEPEDDYQPYSTYDLTIRADGYEPVRIAGVQLLSNVTAIQQVRLLPLGSSVDAENVTIAPHTLWGEFPPKTPEPEVKPLPDAQGYVVLPKPVVPETIVVHDGPPTRSAKDYWIPFKDYIKNVASCEIYSTWPTETIKANILAILSFTLNRIYTEWYRARGYGFQITSSTSYDHAFTYGRNIYDNISRIVDDIFTQYITRPSIRQPLFSQYCDGRNVTCPNWMTQWGSKDLGERGYVAVDILKNFYGQDIYLMEAERVAGVPSSYPGTPVKMGATGNNVRTIQEQLNAVSNNYPRIPKLRVDGTFGENTRQAVVAFQQIFNLADDGIVGRATWYKLSDIYVSVTRMAAGTPR